MDLKDLFRSRFGYINDENLMKASQTDPDFLFEFITKAEINPYTKACAIESLSCSLDAKYLDFLKKCTTDASDEVSISGYVGLGTYFAEDEKKYKFIFDYVKEMQLKETRQKVLKYINSELEFMKMYL